MYKGMEVGKSNSCSGPYTQEDIDALQEWSDSHPEEAPKHEKTLKEDFLEKFPNAQRDPNGIPSCVNPCDIYGGENVKCSDFDCGSGECWNRPLSEVQKNEQRQDVKKDLTAKEGNS